jgi:predicted acylesterase/phospholipase RssA
VIKELVNALRNGDQEYEVVSGISVGAINAHIMSQYPIGQEKDASNKLIDFWFDIAEKNSDLVKSWSWGMIYGFFYENSIYDASDLYDFIESFFKASVVRRHVNIGIANVLTGRYHSFGMRHTDEELIKVLQASISFPGVFKSVQF